VPAITSLLGSSTKLLPRKVFPFGPNIWTWEANVRAALKIIGLTTFTGFAALLFMSFIPYVGPGGGGASGTRHHTPVLCDDINNDPLRPKLAGCIPRRDLNPGEGPM